jgi:hypothetical protein
MPLKNLNKKPYNKITRRKQKEMKNPTWKRNLKRKNPKTNMKKLKTLKKARRNKKIKLKNTASCESQKSSPKMKMDRYE